eukprot:366500_1
MQQDNGDDIHVWDLSNWLARSTFSFFTRFMLDGNKKPWEITDMTFPPLYIQMPKNSDDYEILNIWKLLLKINKKYWIIGSLIYLLMVIVAILNVYIFTNIILIILENNNNSSNVYAFTLCIIFAFADLIRYILNNNHWVIAELTALKTRNIVMNLLLKKITTISSSDNNTNGKILNGISTDVDRLYKGVKYSICCVTGFICLLISVPIYIYVIGIEIIFGFCIMLVITPLVVSITGNRQKYFMEYGLKFSDKRINLLNEMLTAIRVVKMYAYEIPLIRRILNYRVKELYYYKFAILTFILSKNYFKMNEALILSTILMAKK